jgi:glutaredoxin
MTRRALMCLDDLEVDYEYIDVDGNSSASEWVKQQNPDGKERKPTIDVQGTILVEPSNDEIEECLRSRQLLA